jgi:ferredoxin
MTTPSEPAAGRWHVRIDPRLCVGSATCIATAPDHFAFDQDDRSYPKAAHVDPHDALITAARMCPTGALTIVDTADGREL